MIQNLPLVRIILLITFLCAYESVAFGSENNHYQSHSPTQPHTTITYNHIPTQSHSNCTFLYNHIPLPQYIPLPFHNHTSLPQSYTIIPPSQSYTVTFPPSQSYSHIPPPQSYSHIPLSLAVATTSKPIKITFFVNVWEVLDDHTLKLNKT